MYIRTTQKNKHSCESKGDDVLDIHENAPIIAYLQPYEVPIGLTLKEHTRLCIRPNDSNVKAIPFYKCVHEWMNVGYILPKTTHEGLVWHAHEKLGHFGVQQSCNFL
jgi:hypothetical protein